MSDKARLQYKLYTPHLRWCDRCNIPILLKDRCGLCGGPAREVRLTPPGDVRPAFEGDLERVVGACSRFFGREACGKLFPRDKVILLNKVGGVDRSEEVILDGVRMGLLQYVPKERAWRFKPSLEAGRRLSIYGGWNWVRVDEGAVPSVSKGRNVLAPGVVGMDVHVKRGDEVYVTDPQGRAIAVGIARVGYGEALDRGVAVRVRRGGEPGEPDVREGGQSWDDVVRANSDVLDSFEKRAIGFLRRSVGGRPAILSFSGGKDSMAVLILALKALSRDDLRVVFIDTGIEYPETVEYVREVGERYGIHIHVYSAGEGFWRGVEVFGPPAVNYRWCCKVCKMAPTKRALNELSQGSADVLLGIRRVESADRMRRGSIWTSRWVLGERGVSPIYDWPTLAVWLYLFREKAPINPLYRMGFDRIGCWLCPSANLADMAETEKLHPELWSRWRDILLRWAERLGRGRGWAEGGGWRFIDGDDPRGRWLNVSKVLRVRVKVDPEEAANILHTSGRVSGENAITVEKDGSIITFDDGVLRLVRGRSRDLLRVGKTLARLGYCVGCRLCEYSCPFSAIRVADKPVVETSKCTGCSICNQVCPIYVYLPPTWYLASQATGS